MTTRPIIGWDIGGANLKAAHLHNDTLHTAHEPFAIWLRPDELVTKLNSIATALGPTEHAAVTITAELSDIFRTKRDGIKFVIQALQQACPDVTLHIWGTDARFHTVGAALQHPLTVAASNWMATAQLLTRYYPQGILLDIGSTTTDIIPFENRYVLAQGRTDPERLIRGELVYTGVLRTPVMSVVKQVPLWGQWCPVAAEHFATMQDVYLLLGYLTPEQCNSHTADGRPIEIQYARERLARVVCADMDMLTDDSVRKIATHIAEVQIRQLTEALSLVMSPGPMPGPIVGVGMGAFLASMIAARLGLAYSEPRHPLGQSPLNAATATAVAMLLHEVVNND